MRIIFIGSVIFSAKALKKIIDLKAEVVGIITKKESAFNNDFFDLSGIAKSNNIPYVYTTDINSQETLKWIKDLYPDVIFCFGWSNLIKSEILNSSRLGVVGFHPTLLPFNKGRHPLIWAKVLGLPKTGSTFFFMDEGADTGDILSQKEIQISFKDDAQIIYDKIIDVALLQIEEFYPKLKNDTYDRVIQDKNVGNNWRKRTKKDGIIDFRLNSVNICNLVRGLTHPYVGAHIEFSSSEFKVWEVEIGLSDINLNNIEPGKILNIIDRKILVKTGDGTIWLVNHEIFNLPKIGTYLI